MPCEGGMVKFSYCREYGLCGTLGDRHIGRAASDSTSPGAAIDLDARIKQAFLPW